VRADRGCARGLRQAVGLEEKADCRAGTLSGGSKRKLQVGIALLADSHVVLLDEPSSGAARRPRSARAAGWGLSFGPLGMQLWWPAEV